MRELPTIRNLWNSSGGVFVGDAARPHGRVTVEPDWYLNTTAQSYGGGNKGPYRYFYTSNQTQIEVEVPNIKSINIDRSLDSDAASCTITMYNQWHDANATFALGAVQITGGSPGGTVDGIQVDNVEIMSGPVGWDTDILTTAQAVADNINNYISKPNYIATVFLGAVLIAARTPGTASNGLSVDSDTNNITTLDTNMTGGSNMSVSSSDTLGNPGYFTFSYGDAKNAIARWGQQNNSWRNVLVPNALLRTYQGYGGYTNGIPDAITTAVSNGNLAQTGTWLIDKVSIGTNGIIQMTCRDMAKLLIDQMVYGPLVPQRFEMKYCRYTYENVPGTPGTDGTPARLPRVLGPASLRYEDSSTERWLGSGTLVDQARWAFDWNRNNASVSHGWRYWNNKYAKDWWQATCQTAINQIGVACWGAPPGGNYFVWISIMENGVWKGDNTIEYDGDDPGSNIQIYHPNKPSLDTGIPYVKAIAVPSTDHTSIFEPMEWVQLDRVYDAERIRITVASLWNSPWGPNHYRSSVREVRANLKGVEPREGRPAVPAVPAVEEQTIQHDGNCFDWIEPVIDLLLWSGFLFWEPAAQRQDPAVHGILERSGTWPLECLNEDIFDKKSVMSAITSIKEVLGYVFFINEVGGVHFHSPNWWAPGNTDESGNRLRYVPELHDEKILTDYTLQYSDENVRSEIVIGSFLPEDTSDTTQYVRVNPTNITKTLDLTRGMTRPAIWVNEVWTEENEQKLMAALISIHLMLNSRQGSVTAVANPEIQLNDQIRISERITGDSYLHYVRAIRTTMDLETGEYLMTIGTNWLGEEDTWAFDRDTLLQLIERDENLRVIQGRGGGTHDYDNGMESYFHYSSNIDQNQFKVTRDENDPGFNGSVGGSIHIAVVGPNASETAPEDNIDPNTKAFWDSIGQTGEHKITYIDTPPSFPTGYDIVVITPETNLFGLAAWGSISDVDTPVIHGQPLAWFTQNLIDTTGTNSNDSANIFAETNSEFEITGAPGAVTFGGGGTVTTFSVPSSSLFTGVVEVGTAPSNSEVVIAAYPAGITYPDSNVSTVKHVSYGRYMTDIDNNASITEEMMQAAIVWLRSP